jgi:hypothetical protein
MVDRERWEQVCRLYKVEGVSISQIARMTILDRKTVRYSARIDFQQLCATRGFSGSYAATLFSLKITRAVPWQALDE